MKKQRRYGSLFFFSPLFSAVVKAILLPATREAERASLIPPLFPCRPAPVKNRSPDRGTEAGGADSHGSGYGGYRNEAVSIDVPIKLTVI